MKMRCRLCFVRRIMPVFGFTVNILCGCAAEPIDRILDDLQGADKSYPVFPATESEPSFVGGMCVGYRSLPDIRAYDIDTSSVTNIKEIMRIELCRAQTELHWLWDDQGEEKRILDDRIKIAAAKDVPHALRLFETYILPSLEDRSDARIGKLRQQIKDGKSWIYCRTDHKDYLNFFYLNLFPSCDHGRYVFAYLDTLWNKTTNSAVPPPERSPFLPLSPQYPFLHNHYSNSCYEDYCARLPRIDETLDYREEEVLRGKLENAGVYPGRIDVVAVVEVVDVQFMGVTGFDYTRKYSADHCLGCRAEYHIRLDVRKVEQGELASDIYILECKPFWVEFWFERDLWEYYPGITLRVGLQRHDGKLRLIEESIVEPYPPYSDKEINISGGTMIRGPNGLPADREGRLEPLVITYGSHTKVEFRHGEIITSGTQASFADFGVTSKFRVLELKDGANKAYWENVWYAPKEHCLMHDSYKRGLGIGDFWECKSIESGAK